MSEEALIASAAVRALWYALPFFVLWNAITALLGSGKEISEKGEWIGEKFIYKTPHHVLTKEFGPEDNQRKVSFKVPDAEPGTFVQFLIEYYGGRGVAAIGPHFELPIHGMGVSRSTNYGFRLDTKRMATLTIQIPENSDRTIVRVYAISWGV